MNYIEAVCGAGKTETAIRHVIDKCQKFDDKFVIMMPTILLLEQTKRRLLDYGFTGEITAIHGENSDGSVSGRIHDFLDNPESSGVLLISIAAWKWIKGRCVEDWHLIVDECPQVFHVSTISSRIVGDLLLKNLAFDPVISSSYSIVSIRDRAGESIKELWNKNGIDDAFNYIKETAEELHLGAKTYVNSANYQNYVEGNAKTITFYHVMPKTIFKGFKSATIMGANFSHSEIYHIWSCWGVHFNQRVGFRNQSVMPSIHSDAVGNSLDIHYLHDDISASLKSKHKKVFENEFRRALAAIFQGREFIYTSNSDDDPRLLEGFSNARYVKPKAHGQNDYRHIHCAAIYAHFNLSKDQVAFLAWLTKLDKKDVWDLRNKDIYYQFVCRTSLREVPSAGAVVEPKTIVVMDKDMALWLQQLFPGSRVHKFLSEPIAALPVPVSNRPKKTSVQSGAERTKSSRDNKKSDKDHKKLEFLRGHRTSSDLKSHEIGNDKTLIGTSVTNFIEERRWPVSSMGSLYSKEVTTVYYDSFSEIAVQLREASNRVIADKNSNTLFNVSSFACEGEIPRGRTLSDVACSRAILLDMDSDRNCDPLDFASAYSGVEMIIHSTYSSTANRRRWRVIIPLSRPVSHKEYRSIASDISRLADQIGFPFDPSKKQANDFMYLPCQSTQKEGSFFHHLIEGRRSLDVDEWLAI